MGIIELHAVAERAWLHAKIIIYGSSANSLLAAEIAADINAQWNEAAAIVVLKKKPYKLCFAITSAYEPRLLPQHVFDNRDPLNNYFRVEPFAYGNISYVDGLGSNTGYFLAANLVQPSTTAAHEFGHTLGLEHPLQLDIRGEGVPGIMYPRGTLVDAQYQYYPEVEAATNGGTLNPVHRKVTQQDVDDLGIPDLNFNKNGLAVIGKFSSVWHEAEVKEG